MSETRRGFSLQGEINDLYQQYLGRDAEQAGMDYWLGTFASGSTLDDIERAIAASPEAQRRQGMLTQAVATDRTSERLAEFGESPGYTQQYFPGETEYGTEPSDLSRDPIKESKFVRDFRAEFEDKLEGKDVSEWLEVLGRYGAGDATLSELEAVDVSDLMDVEGFEDYYYSVVPRSDFPEPETVSNVDAIDAVLDALPDQLKGVFNEQNITKVIDAVFEGGMDQIKRDMGAGVEIVFGEDWRNWKVFGPLAIPGVPLPPGIFDVTLGDITDAVESVGGSISDFIDKMKTDPIGTIKGIGEDIVKKVKGVFDGTADDPGFGGTLGGFGDWVVGTLGGGLGGLVLTGIYDQVKGFFEPAGFPIPGGTDKDDEEDPLKFSPQGFTPDREIIVDPSQVDLGGLDDTVGFPIGGGFTGLEVDRDIIVDPSETGAGFYYSPESGLTGIGDATGPDDDDDKGTGVVSDSVVDDSDVDDSEVTVGGDVSDDIVDDSEVTVGGDDEVVDVLEEPDSGIVIGGGEGVDIDETPDSGVVIGGGEKFDISEDQEDPDEIGGTGGGMRAAGGGGGRSMFEPQSIGLPGMGDPALLAALQFPVVNYLAESLAKQTKNDLMKGLFEGMI